MNKCLFSGFSCPSGRNYHTSCLLLLLPAVPSHWEHPLSTLLQIKQGQEALGSKPCSLCLTEGERRNRGDRRTRCRMEGTAATSLLQVDLSHPIKKLCPDDENSLSCLPRVESRLKCHNGSRGTVGPCLGVRENCLRGCGPGQSQG